MLPIISGQHLGRILVEKPVTEGQVRKFEKMLADKGVTSAVFQRLLTCGILADAIDPGASLANRRAWRTALELTVEERMFRYVIPAGTTVAELFRDGGYDHRCSGPLPEDRIQESEVALEFKRFRFNRYMHHDAAISEIRNTDSHNPWKEADVLQLLFFGNQRLPSRIHRAEEYLSDTSTVALGSTHTWRDHTFSPRIFWDRRDYRLFENGTRVLVVENITSLSPWSTYLAVREVR
jgi:hypothetical protein